LNLFDWRLRLVFGITMVCASFFIGLYANDLKNIGKDYNQYGVLALLFLWSGCEWIIKSISEQTKK